MGGKSRHSGAGHHSVGGDTKCSVTFAEENEVCEFNSFEGDGEGDGDGDGSSFEWVPSTSDHTGQEDIQEDIYRTAIHHQQQLLPLELRYPNDTLSQRGCFDINFSIFQDESPLVLGNEDQSCFTGSKDGSSSDTGGDALNIVSSSHNSSSRYITTAAGAAAIAADLRVLRSLGEDTVTVSGGLALPSPYKTEGNSSSSGDAAAAAAAAAAKTGSSSLPRLFTVGDRIEAQFRQGQAWYPGTIKRYVLESF